MNVPQVVAYRLNPISARLVYYIARFKISFASPVNLAVNKAVVPEFLQWQVTPQALADTRLGFTHQPYRPTNHASTATRATFARALGEPGVCRRAAAEILDCLPVTSALA